MENVPLRKVTLWAYGIPDDREFVLIGPGWLGTERFDILAKFPADQAADVRKMTQSLLAERFKLQLHREMRQLPAYGLVVAKNGPKIRAADEGAPRTEGRPGRLDATRITVQKLCDLIARLVGQPVLNETGLNGVYSFTLEWTPDETQKAAGSEDAPGGASGPTLFSALQEQLGLKLEGRRAPAEVLIVDRMERTPTEN